jgi:hypothetical protein
MACCALRCNSLKASSGATLYECVTCNYQLSVTAGTIFQDSHKPLSTWLRAIWCVTRQKNGASALGWKTRGKRVSAEFILGSWPMHKVTPFCPSYRTESPWAERFEQTNKLGSSGNRHVPIHKNGLKVAHLIVSLLKRWLLETHQGAVCPGHLACYLDEYTFSSIAAFQRTEENYSCASWKTRLRLTPCPHDLIIRHVRGRGNEDHI